MRVQKKPPILIEIQNFGFTGRENTYRFYQDIKHWRQSNNRSENPNQSVTRSLLYMHCRIPNVTTLILYRAKRKNTPVQTKSHYSLAQIKTPNPRHTYTRKCSLALFCLQIHLHNGMEKFAIYIFDLRGGKKRMILSKTEK